MGFWWVLGRFTPKPPGLLGIWQGVSTVACWSLYLHLSLSGSWHFPKSLQVRPGFKLKFFEWLRLGLYWNSVPVLFGSNSSAENRPNVNSRHCSSLLHHLASDTSLAMSRRWTLTTDSKLLSAWHLSSRDALQLCLSHLVHFSSLSLEYGVHLCHRH